MWCIFQSFFFLSLSLFLFSFLLLLSLLDFDDVDDGGGNSSSSQIAAATASAASVDDVSSVGTAESASVAHVSCSHPDRNISDRVNNCSGGSKVIHSSNEVFPSFAFSSHFIASSWIPILLEVNALLSTVLFKYWICSKLNFTIKSSQSVAEDSLPSSYI